MAENPNQNSYFENYERQRDAELITPPHDIKKKVGSGGIDIALIKRAESLIQNNKTDFIPIAESYLDILEDNIRKAIKQELTGADAFDALLYPLVQLKAQGSMFRYPLITDIAAVLINFLEIIKTLDQDAFEIIAAHNMALQAIVKRQAKGHDNAEAQALSLALQEACSRYFKAHKL